MSSGVGDGCSTDGEGAASTVGLAIGSFSGLCSATWSNRGLITKKNAAARAPPLSNRNTSTPAMIQGNFDFFFAATGAAGNGADAAAACGGNEADVTGGGNGADVCCGAGVCGGKGCETCGGGGGAASAGGAATGGGGGGGAGAGGAGAGGAGGEMSAVFGAPVGFPVGPVFRGRATVAG